MALNIMYDSPSIMAMNIAGNGVLAYVDVMGQLGMLVNCYGKDSSAAADNTDDVEMIERADGKDKHRILIIFLIMCMYTPGQGTESSVVVINVTFPVFNLQFFIIWFPSYACYLCMNRYMCRLWES